ncbi:MAG: hypothetical protein CBD99_000320 [Candidatus Pelagibacter sp. TMED239]|nr:MAG: hypothetical protein CBD99_000320 [Candidatus Pelagibacter sp. TMED239]|tara:strand:- start:2458 stop:3921 length:1464 start_codon:yes stop_codon:yes gene_type:complete
MKRKYYISLLSIIIITIIIYLTGLYLSGNERSKTTIFLKSIIPSNVKHLLKNTVYINQEIKKDNENQIAKVKELEKLYSFKIDALNNLKKENSSGNFENIYFEKFKDEKISSDKNFYNLKVFHSPFLYNPIHPQAKGSAFIEETKKNIIIVDSLGEIYFFKKSDLKSERFFAKNIPNNLRNIIKYQTFYNKYEYSIKDVLIFDDKIYLSFTNETSKNCFNTSILVSDLKYDYLDFSIFFNPNDCVKKDNITGFFNPHIAGGRLVSFNKNHLLFSTGDFQNYKLAQSKDNLFGKILKININNKKVDIVSLGHRNVQGLKYDKNKKLIISTEHGPIGGDEINLNKLVNERILNFGWPQASYGDHYTSEKEKRYTLAPLYKNHTKHGYEEPLIYYIPSIAISEIENVNDLFSTSDDKLEDYFVGSLGKDSDNGQLSIHHLKIDFEKPEIIKYDIIRIRERIRDIKYLKELNLVLMFLESSGSIGILKKIQ